MGVPSIDFADRLTEISAQIHGAGGKDIQIIAATKSQSVETLERLIAVGVTDFGESYAQEFLEKSSVLRIPEINWHFIGQLQSNKVSLLANHYISYEVAPVLLQSVDRKSLIVELGNHFKGVDILMQLDTTGNPQRGGARQQEIPELMDLAIQHSLNPVGIMIIAKQDASQNELASDFKLAKKIQEDLKLPILSAGMSNDYEIAVREGANMVRLGSAFFTPS